VEEEEGGREEGGVIVRFKPSGNWGGEAKQGRGRRANLAARPRKRRLAAERGVAAAAARVGLCV